MSYKLVGHQKQWQFLTKVARLGKLPHAFLFSGPSHIGKRTFALEFVKFLNCENKKENNLPCHICKNCQDIDKGVYPDFHIIEPVNDWRDSSAHISNNRQVSIQISQVRELNKILSLHPYKSGIKAVVIDQAHTMTRDAQSAFLKILEEPVGETLFIIITEVPEKILLTILSRCEKVKFYPVSQDEINNEIQKQGISEDRAKDIVRFSFGRPGLAFSYLSNPKDLVFKKRVVKDIANMKKASINSRFKYARELSQKPKELRDALDIWLRYFRGLLLKAVSGSQLMTEEKYSDLSLEKLVNVIKLIQKTIFLLSGTNVNPRLALEVLLLGI